MSKIELLRKKYAHDYVLLQSGGLLKINNLIDEIMEAFVETAIDKIRVQPNAGTLYRIIEREHKS